VASYREWETYNLQDEDGTANYYYYTPTVHSGTFAVATLNPVPVPAAAWLFGSALIGLAGIKRKK
jgi:hypothetical protein